MTICLYDIDFLHSRQFSPPNLELMKIFNYYYSRGDIVNLAQKNENLSRYNQILYFKSDPRIVIPKSLSLAGENIHIYGYGFYNRYIPLKEQYRPIEPNYLPYILNEDKIKNLKKFNHIQNNSIVRVENNDLTGFNSSAATIYIYDYDFIHLPNAKDFIDEYKHNYKIEFLYPLIADSEELFLKFFTVAATSKRRICVNFKYSKKFFDTYCNEPVIFSTKPLKGEDNPSVYLQRIVQMCLCAKNKNCGLHIERQNFSVKELKEKPLLQLFPYIYNWSILKSNQTCYDFIEQNIGVAATENLLHNKRNLRLLLKQAPQKFDSESVDFFENL